MDNQGTVVRYHTEGHDFSLLLHIETDFKGQPASYSMSTGRRVGKAVEM